MPSNQADQITHPQEGETVFEELRVIIQDVRTLLEAMPSRVEPMLSLIEAMQGAVGTGSIASSNPITDTTPEMAQVDMAVAALNAQADIISATTEHAAEAVRERGDRIEAMLAEIRRIRADAIPA
jgi:hypothetical protein